MNPDEDIGWSMSPINPLSPMHQSVEHPTHTPRPVEEHPSQAGAVAFAFLVGTIVLVIVLKLRGR